MALNLDFDEMKGVKREFQIDFLFQALRNAELFGRNTMSNIGGTTCDRAGLIDLNSTTLCDALLDALFGQSENQRNKVG